MKRIKSELDNIHYWATSKEKASENGFAVAVQLPNGNYIAAAGETNDIRNARWHYPNSTLVVSEGSTFVVRFNESSGTKLALPPHVPHYQCEPVKLEQALKPELIAIMDAFPAHDLIKGTLLAALGELPPDEAMTSKDALQQWLLENYERPVGVEEPTYQTTHARRTTARQPTVLTVEIEVNETETGTCRYSVNRSGCTSSEFTSGELEGLLDEALAEEKDFDGLLEKLEEIALEAERGNIDMDNYGEYSYGDHESSDSEDYVENVTNRRSVRATLEQWVRENATDEQLESLGL
jgi:hypothetical protein